MVTICKPSVLVYNKPRGCGALSIGISFRQVTFDVYLRQKGCNGILHVISSAECTNQSRLFRWVTLLLSLFNPGFLCPAALWPVTGIRPVRVTSQDVICRQPWQVLIMEQIFPICRRGWPVHQPGRLVCCIIEIINSYLFSQFPGYGLVFIRCDRTVHWYHEPQTRFFRTVLMSSVHGIGIIS